MRKKLLICFILLCTVQLAILTWDETVKNQDILQLEYGNEHLFFSYQSTNKTYKDGNYIRINSFCDEETGEYYLFLPNDFKKKKSKMLLYGLEEFVVNQEFYGNDSRVDFLTEGRHSIAVNQSFYVLNVMYGADIPSVFIDLNTDSMQFIHDSKENIDCGFMNVYDEKGKMCFQDTVLEIQGRGNSSWEYQLKKSYSVSLGAKTSLVPGIVEDKWNLIGNGYDPTMLENVMMYDMAEEIGLNYSPQVQNVDLYMEGEYVGVYLITNKIKIAPSSVNINDLEKDLESLNTLPLEEYEQFGKKAKGTGSNKGYLIPNKPDDVTGGYLLEKDHWERYERELSGFVTDRAANIVIQSPKHASKEAVEYIQNFVQEIEDAINETDGINRNTGKHYSEYIDVDSFVKSYLIQEVTKNMDLDATSQFFYKPEGKEERLYSGPVWDFDYTFGMSEAVVNGTSFSEPEDLLAVHYMVEGPIAFSLTGLYRHQSYVERVKDIYQEKVRGAILELATGGMDRYVEEIRESARMNQTRWSISKDYDVLIEEIREFMVARIAYLDKVWEIEE